MIDVGAVNHYPGVLHDFRQAHPDLQLHLRVDPSLVLLEQLVAGQLDLVVCVEPRESIPGVDTEMLLTEQLAVYRPGTMRLGPASKWGPWVLFPDGSHTREIVAAALRDLGSPIEVVAESHQPEVLREMVLLGLGWTVLPVVQAETAARPLDRGRILTERTLVAAVRSGTVLDPAVAELQAFLRSR
jgi:DNA-binding transcriptional LysR family regulator